MGIELVVKLVFEVKSAATFYLNTFMISVLTQVYQSRKILHVRMTSFHGLVLLYCPFWPHHSLLETTGLNYSMLT